MSSSVGFVFLLGVSLGMWIFITSTTPACCPAPKGGKPVVNADQTVILIWDAKKKRQHFIRKATFQSESDDFGFLIPSPNLPELSESANDAFPYLTDLTKPKVVTKKRPQGGGCVCGGLATKNPDIRPPGVQQAAVKVKSRKIVAGFDAAVLEATTAKALVTWLKDNGYAWSPEIQKWAEPYIQNKWHITALKIAKEEDGKENKGVAAKALRMSFDTDQPLFPYREPEYTSSAKNLIKGSRMLRIYFIAEARYKGELTKDDRWTGKVAWSNRLKAKDRQELLKRLKLPETTGPDQWWLTEFEDYWPYKVAPADVYFSKDENQSTVEREPIIRYVASTWPNDAMSYALVAVVVVPPIMTRVRRKKCNS